MEKLKAALYDLMQFDFKNRKKMGLLGPFKASEYPNGWNVPIIITLGIAGVYLFILTAFFIVSGRFNPSKRSVIALCIFLAFYVVMYIRKHFINAGAARDERKQRDRMIAERKQYVEKCTAAASECGVYVYPWWERFDPCKNFMKNYSNNRTWAIIPKKPFSTRDGKQYFDRFISGERLISCDELIEKYIALTDQNGNYIFKCFIGEPIFRDANYTIAHLGSYWSESATFVQEVWEADKNPDEKVKAYESKLDWDESLANAFWERDFSTDKEMYLKGYGTTLEYLDKRDKRDEKIEEYKKNLGKYKTRVIDEGLYDVGIDYHGYVIFDESFNRIIGLLVPEIDASIRVKTNSPKAGDDCEVVEMFNDSFRTNYVHANDVIQHITFYDNNEFDFTINKPDNITDDEWGLWIYSHYSEDFLFIEEPK